MQTRVELAIELAYLDREKGSELMEQGQEVGRILNGLLKSLRTGATPNTPNSANTASSAPASSAKAHVS